MDLDLQKAVQPWKLASWSALRCHLQILSSDLEEFKTDQFSIVFHAIRPRKNTKHLLIYVSITTISFFTSSLAYKGRLKRVWFGLRPSYVADSFGEPPKIKCVRVQNAVCVFVTEPLLAAPPTAPLSPPLFSVLITANVRTVKSNEAISGFGNQEAPRSRRGTERGAAERNLRTFGDKRLRGTKRQNNAKHLFMQCRMLITHRGPKQRRRSGGRSSPGEEKRTDLRTKRVYATKGAAREQVNMSMLLSEFANKDHVLLAQKQATNF
ncbi:hypothetical protein L596_007076 [Steinernema carpocapsae]|uniref:Uncharacterized protein n=1 Tax=Steinernema carpocapsae TaxID=34508 RepID=A0A4U5P8W4_STECR|nr:hypothetical protein L596_007076 [Steinernema carpocapsae]